MEGTTTTVSVYDDKFVLEREGNTTTKMEFIYNTSTVSLYNTPYGMLDLRVNTKKIDINMTEDGGSVTASYDMELSGQDPIRTDIVIEVKLK